MSKSRSRLRKGPLKLCISSNHANLSSRGPANISRSVNMAVAVVDDVPGRRVQTTDWAILNSVDVVSRLVSNDQLSSSV
ncbi:hypothetical protein PsYK624_096670 [Phanerochaete sordida]|uniref:Uncharacterized protein n=1 Tax=Phanerochaete sordida TaxID=48140 RepID=A0A9P3LG90_9APHY|nr:hypothetical protein PsYK624_096670 [Phanerochaete sordida]